MKYYLRRFKKTDECEAAPCEAPISSPPAGMGDAVPVLSGDRWDNVFGLGWGHLTNVQRIKRRKSRKKKSK